jgi:hypothetical protein
VKKVILEDKRIKIVAIIGINKENFLTKKKEVYQKKTKRKKRIVQFVLQMRLVQ